MLQSESERMRQTQNDGTCFGDIKYIYIYYIVRERMVIIETVNAGELAWR